MSKPDAKVIEHALQCHGRSETNLHLFSELASTSAWLWQQAPLLSAAGSIHESPHLCATDWQTAGSGRRGKSWQSNRGNITFSLMTELPVEPSELMGLSLVTGIAVAESLRAMVGISVELKWPNDVLYGGAKLGGLLTELKMVGQGASPVPSRLMASAVTGMTRIVTGIGLNLRHDDALCDLGIGGTSLERAGGNSVERDVMIGELAANVLIAHEKFHQQGWAVFADTWRQYDCLAGKMVSVVNANSVEQVMAVGVNDGGALMVKNAERTYPVFSGEVSVRPAI